ncbi:MAG: MBOAT family protein [Ruminococcaceae bacterium]|nr:MBOAT family protein [Oscillospiraceae bacterium]
MRFTSFVFLFWFLPLVLLLYVGLPTLLHRFFRPRWRAALLQNGILLSSGLLFYAWGEPLYVLLLLGTVLFDYCAGRAIAQSKRPRPLLWGAVSLHVMLLLYFKYAALLIPSPPRMPLGLSFYTFLGISYVADVYSSRIRCEESLLSFGTYMTLFPLLTAGPIARYETVAGPLRQRAATAADAAAGARRFLAGLAKKVLLANPAGGLFHTFAAFPKGELTVTGALLALFGFFFQIYYDFSGYSDMAIGLGRMFGLPLPENFNYPYTAIGFRDFWRRWHITLSAFFRDYVYIPLGGSRRGVFRTVLALFAVWSLTGLWHGATLNFLLWGLYYFLLIVAERWLPQRLKTAFPRPVCRVITILGVLLGWLIFAFDSSADYLTLSALGSFLKGLLGQNGVAAGADLYDLLRHLPFFAVAAIGATPLPRRLYHRAAARFPALSLLLPAAALLLSVAYLADASFLPFLYARF